MATDNGNSLSREDRLERDWRPQCGRCGFDSETGGFDPKRDVFVQRNPATDSPYWIHCPNPKCMGEPYGEEVILDRESGKTKRVPFPEKSESQEAKECFYETTKRPRTGSSGSSGTKGRKKPVKRDKARVEQDVPAFMGGRGDVANVKRLCKMQRVELTMSERARVRLKELSWENRRMDGTLEPEITTIRRFLIAKRLTTIEAIPRLEYGDPKSKLQAKLTSTELKLLDGVATEFGVSRGEVVEAGIWNFFPKISK